MCGNISEIIGGGVAEESMAAIMARVAAAAACNLAGWRNRNNGGIWHGAGWQAAVA